MRMKEEKDKRVKEDPNKKVRERREETCEEGEG